MKSEEVYQKALIQFGVDSQIDMMIEECSELITALQHMKRGRENNVPEEMADIFVVYSQLKPYFNKCNVVDEWINIKTLKLKEKIYIG